MKTLSILFPSKARGITACPIISVALILGFTGFLAPSSAFAANNDGIQYINGGSITYAEDVTGTGTFAFTTPVDPANPGRLRFLNTATLNPRILVDPNIDATLEAVSGTLTVTNTNPLPDNHGRATYINAGGTFSILGNVVYDSNFASGDGGAIFLNDDAIINLRSGTAAFLKNTAGLFGGAIRGNDQVIITGSDTTLIMRDNSSVWYGGGISGENGISITGHYTDILFQGNVAVQRGGALQSRGDTSQIIIDATATGTLAFTDNTAGNWHAGAIDAGGNNSLLSITGTYGAILIQSNTAAEDAGALNSGGSININVNTGSLTISQNTAGYTGGALFAFYGSINISGEYGAGGILIDSNRASTINGAGAFYAGNNISITANSTGSLAISNNTAGSHGGAFYTGNGNILIGGRYDAGIFIASNTSGASGGALYSNSDITITATAASGILIANNTATRGGAIFASSDFILDLAANTTFTATNNRAASDANGGFLFVNSGSILFDIGSGATATIGDASSVASHADSITSGTTVDIIKNGKGALILWGDNTAHLGNTIVNSGTLILRTPLANSQASIGRDYLIINAGGEAYLAPAVSTGTYTFNNNLVGTGYLDINLHSPDDVFQMVPSTSPLFSGTVRFRSAHYTLEHDDFHAASVITSTNNLLIVGSGSNHTRNFIYDTGTTRFDLSGNVTDPTRAAGWIDTGTLNFGAAGQISYIQIDSALLSGGTINATPLLQQDDPTNDVQLINANETTGVLSNLRLIDLNGTLLTNTTTTSDIIQNNLVSGVPNNSGTVAIGTYDLAGLSSVGNAGTRKGLYLASVLTQIDLQAGKTTVFTTDTTNPQYGDEFHARIVGDGDLWIAATNTITINSSGLGQNTYTGTTTAATGVLAFGDDNVLGETTYLDIKAGAKVTNAAHSQTINAQGLQAVAGNIDGILEITGTTITYAGDLTGTGTVTFTGTTNPSGRLAFATTATTNPRIVVTSNVNATLEAANDSTLTITNTNPTLATDGGAAYIEAGGTLNHIGNITYASNTVTAAGGAIYLADNAKLNFDSDTITLTRNTAANTGGAIHANADLELAAANATTLAIAHNTALNTATTGSGGALYAGGNVRITGDYTAITLDSNAANAGGGAIHSALDTLIDVTTGTLAFTHNTANGIAGNATQGGAIRTGIYGNIAILGTYGELLIASNTAHAYTANTGFGGAFFTNNNITIDLAIAGNITITGNEATNGSGGAFYAGGNILINTHANGTAGGLAITNNIAGSGGALVASGIALTGTYAAVSITGNTATINDGGALHSAFMGVRLSATTALLDISRNTAAENGGAIYALTDQISLTGDYGNILITSNTALAGSGGALYARTFYGGGTLAINTHTTGTLDISRNTAGTDGGALYAGQELTLTGDYGHILITSNTALAGSGGALYSAGTITIDTATTRDLTMRGNTAGVSGGAAGATGDILISGNYNAILLSSNTATGGMGGALFSANNIVISATTTRDFEITQNYTYHHGGALGATGGNITITGNYANLLITSNTSAIGFGGAAYAAGDITIDTHTTGTLRIASNTAGTGGSTKHGGAFRSYGGITITGSYGTIDISGNTVRTGEGGAFYAGGNVTIDANTHTLSITGNRALRGSLSASGAGGAIYSRGTIAITANDSIVDISNNHADGAGGAFGADLGLTITLTGNTVFTATNNVASTHSVGGFAYAWGSSLLFDIGASASATIGHAGSIASYADSLATNANVDVIKTGDGALTLWGKNVGIYGNTLVRSGTLIYRSPVDNSSDIVGHGRLDISEGAEAYIAPNVSTPTFTFSNTLAGDGYLDVDLFAASNVFTFSAPGKTTGFFGTARFRKSTYTLQNDDFRNATFISSTGNHTTVGSGTQHLANLTLDGGRIDFGATIPADLTSPNFIAVNDTITITSASGTIGIKLPMAGLAPSLNPQAPLLQQDDGVYTQLASSGTTIANSGLTNIVLLDINSGSTITNPETVNINQNSELVATGTYDYFLASKDDKGLYINYGLKAVDILADKTLLLDDDTTPPETAAEFKAIISGSGNLAIEANSAITLKASNSYTGTTFVYTGTLISGADDALGQTAFLLVTNSAAYNLNGKNQSIVNGGTISGHLFGSGSLGLGGQVIIDTANTGFTANVGITGTTYLANTAGIGLSGTAALANDSELQIAGSGTFSKTLDGTGQVSLLPSATVSIAGTNSTYTGTFHIDTTARLIAETTANLGEPTDGGNLSGTGVFEKQNASTILTISHANLDYSGTTIVTGGTLQLKHLEGIGLGDVVNNDALDLAATGTFSNNISGSGTTYVTAGTSGDYVYLTGSNQTDWYITDGGAAQVTTQDNLGDGSTRVDGLLSIDSDTAWTYTNVLTGTGRLLVDTNNTAFNFDSAAGTAFQGTAELHHLAFDLQGDNTAALTQATLQIDTGASVVTGSGVQQIGNLTLQSGTLAFTLSETGTAAEGIIRTGILDVHDTKLVIDTSKLADNEVPLLQQDDGKSLRLIESSTLAANSKTMITGDDLVDHNGNQITNASHQDINQQNEHVANGTYDYAALASNDGLDLTYILTELELLAGKTTTLDNDISNAILAGADELHALVTGSGNLLIAATESITLNNTNTYTGTTLVVSGTLIAGADDALGQTAQLYIDTPATFNLNGHTQTIADGGQIDGHMIGSGTMTFSAGTMTITSANTNYSAHTSIDTPATVRLTEVAGLGTGSIQLDGLLNLDNATSGTFANAIAGAGQLHKTNTGTATIITSNTGFTGAAAIDQGRLTATKIDSLGTAGIMVAAGADFEQLGVSGTLQNTLGGAGTHYVTTSTITISSAARYAIANTTLNADGTLILADHNIALGNLNMHDGVLAFAPPASFSPGTNPGSNYHRATIAALGSTQGTFRINLDFTGASGLMTPANGIRGNTLAIANDSAADLPHLVHLNYIGTTGTNATSFELITTGNGLADFRLDVPGGKLDIGLLAYELVIGNGEALTPIRNNWYLAADGPSGGGETIIDSIATIPLDWNISMDALYLRMGDVRAEILKTPTPGAAFSDNRPSTGNVWLRARAYNLNAQNSITGTPFEQYGYGVTGGIDNIFLPGYGANIAGLFIDGGSVQRDFSSRGKSYTDTIALGAYLTHLRYNGWFVDLVARVDRYKNRIETKTPDHLDINGHYNTQSYGASLEVGRRLQRSDGWWVEPTLQASFMWLDGADFYTTPNTQRYYVRTENAHSAQYRALLRFGRQIRDSKWHLYGKVAGVAEDSSGGELYLTEKNMNPSYDGKRVELGFGTTYLINDVSQWYFDYEYAKASAYERPWTLNLGYRRLW